MKLDRIIVYLFMVATSVILVYFYGGYVSYAFLYLFVLILLFSVISSLAFFFLLEFSHSLTESTIINGENVNYSFTLKNRSIFPMPFLSVNFFNLDALSEVMPVLHYHLMPKEEMNFTCTFKFKYFGAYQIGVDKINIVDPLGLYKITRRLKMPLQIHVNPKISNVTNFIHEPGKVFDAFGNRCASMESVENNWDLSFYTGGSMRNIHWKLSAKMNHFIIKSSDENEKAYGNNSIHQYISINPLFPQAPVILLPDLSKKNIKIEDKIAEALASTAYYCCKKLIPLKLLDIKDSQNYFCYDYGVSFESIYERISKLIFIEGWKLSKGLDMVPDGANPQHLVLFTAGFASDILKELASLTFKGFTVTVIHISEGHDDDIASSIEQCGININIVRL